MATDCQLAEVGKFTNRTVRWKESEGGGKVPVSEPLDKPYFRFYCTCGAVGAKRWSEASVGFNFLAHQANQTT